MWFVFLDKLFLWLCLSGWQFHRLAVYPARAPVFARRVPFQVASAHALAVTCDRSSIDEPAAEGHRRARRCRRVAEAGGVRGHAQDLPLQRVSDVVPTCIAVWSSPRFNM